MVHLVQYGLRILVSTFQNFRKGPFSALLGDAGDWTSKILHARQMLWYWAMYRYLPNVASFSHALYIMPFHVQCFICIACTMFHVLYISCTLVESNFAWKGDVLIMGCFQSGYNGRVKLLKIWEPCEKFLHSSLAKSLSPAEKKAKTMHQPKLTMISYPIWHKAYTMTKIN